MGAETKIEWTDHTFNPWWGCEKVSPACKHCYAEAFAKRTGHDVWGANKPRRFFGPKHWAEPLKWNAAAESRGVRERVFCASMADVFEMMDGNVGAMLDTERARLFSLIEHTPSLDWQLLTKRPENVLSCVPGGWRVSFPSNVWVGATAENRECLLTRYRELALIPAKVRFLSCEPLLEDLTERLAMHSVLRGACSGCGRLYGDHELYGDEPMVEDDDGSAVRCGEWTGLIHWVITGVESGGKRRPTHPDWTRSLRDVCQEHAVAFFYKQDIDATGRKIGLPVLDGRQHGAFPEVRP